MRIRYPNASKAFNHLVRTDGKNLLAYRAQLRYFHAPQRAILGMTTAYTEVDEIHEWAAGWANAFNADRRLWVVPESKPPTYRCACGDVWPDGTLGCGHTYTQCDPTDTPPHPHANPPA